MNFTGLESGRPEIVLSDVRGLCVVFCSTSIMSCHICYRLLCSVSRICETSGALSFRLHISVISRLAFPGP